MSYVHMRAACGCVIRQMGPDGEQWEFSAASDFGKALTLMHYLGLPGRSAKEMLSNHDAAAKAGWRGKRVDKEEVSVWDVL